MPKQAITEKNLEQIDVKVAKTTDDLMSYFNNQFDEYNAKADAAEEENN